MSLYLRYALLLTAGIFRLTSSSGQADTVCSSNPVGNYSVQGWDGSTFSWDTQTNGTIISGQGNDSIQVSWNSTAGTYQLEVVETSAEGCVGLPKLIDVVVISPSINITASPACSADLLTYSFEVAVSAGVLTSSLGNVVNISGNSWSVADIVSGTDVLLTLTQNGCQITLTIPAPNCDCPDVPLPISAGDVSYCAGDAVPGVSATVIPGLTIDWYSLPIGGFLLAEDTAVYAPGAPGVYFAEARDSALGCVSASRIPVTITEIALPVLAVSQSPDSVCSGGTIQLIATGAEAYNWSPSDGLSVTNNDSTVATVTQELTYTVTGTSGQCSAIDSVTVYLLASPQVLVSPVTTGICIGDSVMLTASGASSFIWMIGDSTICSNCANFSVSPTSATVYEIIGSSNGCSDTSQVSIQVSPDIDAQISGDTVTCENGQITLEALGGGSYVWNTGDTTSVIQFTAVSSQDNYVVATSGFCSDTAFRFVLVNPAPELTISEDTTIIQGGTASLTVSGADAYLWSPITNLTCDQCADPFANPFETTNYCVEGTTSSGCRDSACVEVKVEIICDEFFIPNVFAPGNGGNAENECFRVYGTNCITEIKLSLYNRWGELVFTSTHPDDCWDGTLHGKEVNSGVFVYYVDAVFINGDKVNKKGNVTLIR